MNPWIVLLLILLGLQVGLIILSRVLLYAWALWIASTMGFTPFPDKQEVEDIMNTSHVEKVLSGLEDIAFWWKPLLKKIRHL